MKVSLAKIIVFLDKYGNIAHSAKMAGAADSELISVAYSNLKYSKYY